jgi:hypothetical protein
LKKRGLILNSFIIKASIVVIVFHLVFNLQASAQVDNSIENQAWGMVFLNWKMNEKWFYNQDIALMHSFATPAFNRFFFRSQFNRRLSKITSLHGGLIYIYTFHEKLNNTVELRPWVGTQLRWPQLGRFDFLHYLRFEQRFRHIMGVEDWDNDFRIRYRLMTNVPLNHGTMIDKTIYAQLAYEFYSTTFDVDIRFAFADIHRIDGGFGYRQDYSNRYELNLIAFHSKETSKDSYALSSLVLFFKYRHFFNWQ